MEILQKRIRIVLRFQQKQTAKNLVLGNTEVQKRISTHLGPS